MLSRTSVADTRSVDTATVAVTVERVTPVGNYSTRSTDSLICSIVDRRRVIQFSVVPHQHVVDARLLHCRYLGSRPREIPGDL